MYFPISELHGWGQRFADQPQTIYSELPKKTLPAAAVMTAKNHLAREEEP